MDVILMDDPVMQHIKKIKAIADDINMSLDPIFDHEKFLDDVKCLKAVAELKLKSCNTQLELLAAARIFTSTEECELDMILRDVSVFEKEIEVYNQIIKSIEDGDYYYSRGAKC